MGKRRKEKTAAPAPAGVPGGRGVFTALTAILLLAALLRCWHLDAPVGGFHAVNEANYLSIARHFFSSSLLLPTPDGQYVFLETPPLYPYVLHGVFRVFGVSIVAARLVSVASSLLLIVATFLLGRRLFGSRPALFAALLLAVSPVAVLTGRNVQTDSTLLAFLMLGLLFFQRAEEGSRRDWLLSGAFFGLALFTKLFAIVSAVGLLLVQSVSRRGFGWLRERARWEAAGVAAAPALLFYAYHAMRDLPHLRRDVAGGAAVATTFPSGAGEWAGLGLEALWAFSPLVALLLLAGTVAALARPSPANLLVLAQLAAFLLFYLFVHKHSYYLLTLLPFGALLAGDLLASLRRSLAAAGLAAASLSAIFLSAVDVTSMKLGFREFEELGLIARSLPQTEHLYVVDSAFRDNAGTVLFFYDPRARLAVIEDLPAQTDGRLLLPAGEAYLLRFVPPQATPPPSGWLFERERFGLTLFGRTLAEAHPNPHFFRQGRYLSPRTGGFRDFGASRLRVYPALALIPVPAGVALYRTERGLSLAAEPQPQNR